MTENDKLERIARAICVASGYGADPDRDIQLGDGRSGKRWEHDIPKARAAMDAMDDIDAMEKNCQTTAPFSYTGKRLITLGDELDEEPSDVEETEE